MSMKDFKLNRPKDKKVETFEKVSINTERREKQKLMQQKTLLPELIKKKKKKTVLTIIYTVVNSHKTAITTHAPAFTLIISFKYRGRESFNL